MLSRDNTKRLVEIISRLVEGDFEWLTQKNIQVSDKPLFWILNYGIGDHNEYNCLTRALVVAKEKGGLLDRIVSFPFIRFFNRHEGPAEPVDLSDSEMIEKMDGTFVGVFRYENRLYWHTRRLCSSSPEDMKLTITGFHGGKYNFLEEIGKSVAKLNISGGATYMFEFIHPMTRVLTEYTPDQYGLYLLGMRWMNESGFLELSEDQLDKYAEDLGVSRPRRWDSLSDEGEIRAKIDLITLETPKFEGFVFRDKSTGARIKLKSEEYVKFHHVLSQLCYKNLLGIVLSGEESEVLSYFPHAAPRIDLIKERFSAYLDYLQSRRVHWSQFDYTKKDLAFILLGRKAKKWCASTGGPVDKIPGAENSFVASQILSCYGLSAARSRKRMSDELSKYVLGHNKNPNKVLRLIDLQESEEL